MVARETHNISAIAATEIVGSRNMVFALTILPPFRPRAKRTTSLPFTRSSAIRRSGFSIGCRLSEASNI